MKNTLFLLCIFISTLKTFAQNFEGKIVYSNIYKSKTAGLSNEQLTSMMGNTNIYYIKNGNYKSETNGSFAQWQLYVNSENKLYSKLANSEAILWNDGSNNIDQVLSSEIHKNATVILGYTCDELILKCKSGEQQYYYTSKLPVNAQLYEKHLFGNWYFYLKIAGAIPLKMIINNPQLTIESIATKVEKDALPDNFFLLPANVKTIKNPYE